MPKHWRHHDFPQGAIALDDAIAEAYRIVARYLSEQAIHVLDEEELGTPERIHALRVATKRLRALWQLHRPFCDRSLGREADRHLRDLARRFSVERDRHVFLRTIEDLRSEDRAPGADERLAVARDLLRADESSERRLERGLREAASIFTADRRAWQRVPRVADRELLERGLERTRRKAARRADAALRTHHGDDLHRWRKWAKYLRYQLEPLARPERAGILALYEDLKLLGRHLGHYHDLDNLRRALDDDRCEPIRASLRLRLERLDGEITVTGAAPFRASRLADALGEV